LDTEIEVYCPEYGKLFKKEKEMLKHYHKEHEEATDEQYEENKEAKNDVQCEYLTGYSCRTTRRVCVASTLSSLLMW